MSTGAVVGLSQMSEPASASVALAFTDADVDLPEDKTIEDLRLTGEVTGDYNSGSEPVHNVLFLMNVDFDFGSYDDSKRFRPDEDKGTVSWHPSHSLVDETDFDPSGDVTSTNASENQVSYNATVSVQMRVIGKETGDLVASAKTGDTATITFHEPDGATETPDDGSGGTDEETANASVEITFGFEVDK